MEAMSDAALLEDPGQFIAIGQYDWYETKAGKFLHWAVIGNEYYAGIAMDWAVTEPIRLACGRTASYLCIPGMMTRMGAERCKDCCRVLGLPEGKGSPKNDDACRAILGLEVKAGT